MENIKKVVNVYKLDAAAGKAELKPNRRQGVGDEE